MKDWLILICVGIVAVFAFRERDRWLPQKAATAETAATVTQPPLPEHKEGPAAQPQPTPPPPQPPTAEEQLAPDYSSEKAKLAALVGQSQRAALARYPSLGEATSEMNIRFNYRYKRLLAEYSPRLQDPAWPVQLADECAQAAGVRPVGVAVAATTPPPQPKPRMSVATAVLPPPRPAPPAPPADAPTPSLRVSPEASAQTLVFHPTTASAPPAPVAPVPPGTAALPFVTLDAVNQNSGNNYTYNWGSYYGWYDISFQQTVGISINLKNMSRVPAAVNVRWIFFARNAKSGSRFIFAASGKEFDLTPGQSASLNADSPLMRNREINYGWIGERYMYGSKYEGWVVQLLERGTDRIIKQTGSTGYLEDLTKRSEFANTLEDYRTKSHGQGVAGL